MTYEVRSGDHRDHYVTLQKAVVAHTRNVTSRLPSTLYGPETLGSDGIMAREVIADYQPPQPVPGGPQQGPPTGGSIRAYWYARGQVDAMDGLAWFDETDAARFSLEQQAAPQSGYAGEWKRYLSRNAPEEV